MSFGISLRQRFHVKPLHRHSRRQLRSSAGTGEYGAVVRSGREPRWNTLRFSGVILLSTAALSSCVGPPAAEWAGTSEDVECPITPSDASGRIRIGYLGNPAPDLYLQDQQLAEACLPKVEISWTRFPTGQDIVQGFAAGSVDIAAFGSTPTTKALSAPLNLDVSVVAVNSVVGETEALVAKKAKTIKDLKGSRIAVPFSSTSHYSLLNALIDAGLDPKTDVEIVNISPDKLPAAWKSDQIDAAYVWDPTLAQLKEGAGGSTPGRVLTDSADQAKAGHPTYNVSLASNGWSSSHPEILHTFLSLQSWAVDHADEDPEDFGKVNATASGMDEDSASRQISGQRFIHGSEEERFLTELVEQIHATAEFLAEQGEIPSVKDLADYERDIRSDLWKEYQ